MVGDSKFRKRFIITIIITIILLSIFVWFIPSSSNVTGNITCRSIDFSSEIYNRSYMEENVDFSCGIHVWTDYYNEDTMVVIEIIEPEDPEKILFNKESSNVRHDESIKWRYNYFVWGWDYVNHPDLPDGEYEVILYFDFADGIKSSKCYEPMIIKNGISFNNYEYGSG